VSELFVVTPPGLEAVCAAEVRSLISGEARPVSGGVVCAGDAGALLRLHLGSRIASRILVRLWEGPLVQLRRAAAAIDFGAFLAPGTTYAVAVSGGGTRPAQLAGPVDEAIRRQVPGARPAGRGEAAQGFAVRLAAGTVTISADATGEHLHLRGYRQETGAAPLRENLAAGILALAGWEGATPLFDPMCGSGTFLIEGALQALRRPPGAERTFACERWPSIDPALIGSERAALRAAELPAPPAPILGSDRNAGALGVARRNAQRAGVLEHIRLERRDATTIEPPAPAGLVVANPPYGKRVGEQRELAELYRRFGERLRSRFGGWTAAILLADERLVPILDLPAPEQIRLRNGGIPCTLVLARL